MAKKKPKQPTGPIVPGGRNPSRVYERDVIDRTVPRRIPQPAPRVYEQNLIEPYRQGARVTPRMYETGSGGAQQTYGQPQRLYESDIIAAQRPNPALVRAGQGRQGGGYGPIQPGGYGPQPGDGSGLDSSGGSGSSGGIGGTGVSEEPPVDPEQAAFGPSTQAIQGYYDTASKDLADPYNDYMNKARSGAESLGLNFASDDNVKLADLAARKLQENYDLNETSDLATVEKMKGINRDSFTQMLIAAEAGLLGPASLVVPEVSSGGGGGGGGGRGRGGSGGSSDNPFSEKATQDEAFYNPGMVSAISGIADPQLRDYADLVYAGTGTNPRSALNRAVSDFEKFSSFRPPAPTARRGSTVVTNMANTTQKLIAQAKKKKAANDMKIAQAAINFFKNWSPGYKPQTTAQKVQTTSTTKHS